MGEKRTLLAAGKDHTDMLPVFKSLIEKAGARRGEALIWAGCEGACYAMATFFSYFLCDLGLELYFATDADLNRLRRLEVRPDVGVVAAEKVPPVKGKIVVLMSGLVNVPFENVLRLVSDGLADDGVVIGETVVPRLFESEKWHEKIPMRFVFEFEMVRPAAFEIEA